MKILSSLGLMVMLGLLSSSALSKKVDKFMAYEKKMDLIQDINFEE